MDPYNAYRWQDINCVIRKRLHGAYDANQILSSCLKVKASFQDMTSNVNKDWTYKEKDYD